jgi:hypothetical protein
MESFRKERLGKERLRMESLRKERLRKERLGMESLRKERVREWKHRHDSPLDAQEDVRERILTSPTLATSAGRPTSGLTVTGLLVCACSLTPTWGAIHQLLNIILKLRILVLLPVSKLPYVVIVKNYSLIGE